MTPLHRREFLGAAVAGAAGFTLGNLGLPRVLGAQQDPAAATKDHRGLGVEHEALSVCGGCSAGCSVKLRIVEERLVGVRGNPHCPLGSGGLCARGISEVEAYYEPDRIVGPLVRDGDRGKDRFKLVSWETALGQVSQQLSRLVAAGKGARVGAILSGAHGSTGATVARALAAVGSPHVYYVDSLRDEAAASFAALATGSERAFGYDLETTDLLLSFGAPVLEGWLSPAYVARRFGQGRQRADSRLRLLQIESRMSPTAMRADEWIRCVPGTEPLLALALAGVLVREGLISPNAEQSVVGLAPWKDKAGRSHRGLRPLLDYAYAPTMVSKETGVSVADILRLARAFAAAKNPLAVGEQTAGSAGVFGLSAVHLLNALHKGSLSSLTLPGAIPLATLGEGPASSEQRLDRPPLTSVPGTPVWRTLGAFELEGRAPPFDVLFLEDGAALSDVVAGDPSGRLLSRIPLVVSFASSLDASTSVADVVLPSTSYFERALDVEIDSTGFVAVAAALPALPPLVDARSPSQVVCELVRRASVKLSLGTDEQIVRQRLSGLFGARRGMAYGTPFRRNWMQQMESAGWWTPESTSAPQFMDSVFERGGWIDPFVARPRFDSDNPYAVDARGRGFEPAARALFAQNADDDSWLPRAEVQNGSAGSPQALLLVPFTVGVLHGRGTPNRPSLLALAAPHVRTAFHPWAELNTVDAARLGVESGGRVRIASEHGEVIVAVRVTPGVRPGSVALASAPAAGGAGRYAKNWKSGAERLMAGISGRLMGARTGRGMKVLVKAETREAS